MRCALIVPTLLMTLAGCGQDEGSGRAFISATIDGASWSAEAQQGQVVYNLEAPDGDGIWSAATRSAGSGSQFLSLVLPIPPALGDHPLDGSAARLAFQNCPDAIEADCLEWSAVAAHPGTLTIDRVESASGLIEGHFSVVVYALGDPAGATKTITSGRFRIYAPSVFILD